MKVAKNFLSLLPASKMCNSQLYSSTIQLPVTVAFHVPDSPTPPSTPLWLAAHAGPCKASSSTKSRTTARSWEKTAVEWRSGSSQTPVPEQLWSPCTGAWQRRHPLRAVHGAQSTPGFLKAPSGTTCCPKARSGGARARKRLFRRPSSWTIHESRICMFHV